LLPNFFKRASFGLILLAGVVMRFHALDRQSLWDDEMSTIHMISTPIRNLMQHISTEEGHPPLYFLQLRLWGALRLRSLVKLRANSAAWGCISLILIYLLGRRYGGERAGLLAMAFLALSPYHLAYSQELRSYAMAIALSLGAALAVERRAWVWVGVLWTALLYTHYWGAFVVAAQAIYGFLNASQEERKPVATAFLAACGLFALWLPVFIQQLAVVDRLCFWVSAFSIANLAKVFLAYSGILFNMASWTFYLPARVWILGTIGLLFAISLVKGLLAGPRAAVLWLGIGLGVPWLLSIWKASVFVWYRYPVIMLPAFVLLVASGLLTLRPKGLRIVIIAVCLGSQVWGCWIFFHQWQKANPKAVVQYVHWLRKPNMVVIRPAYFAELFNFYDLGTTATLDEHILDSPEKRQALKGYKIILLAFDVPSDPIADALLREFKQDSGRYFPGLAHLGITVYQLE
jgi:hypothetical protein